MTIFSHYATGGTDTLSDGTSGIAIPFRTRRESDRYRNVMANVQYYEKLAGGNSTGLPDMRTALWAAQAADMGLGVPTNARQGLKLLPRPVSPVTTEI